MRRAPNQSVFSRSPKGSTPARVISPFKRLPNLLIFIPQNITVLAFIIFTETKCFLTQGLGSQGLNKGLTATICRNGIFNAVYFGFYHSVKGFLPELQVAFHIFKNNLQSKPLYYLVNGVYSIVDIVCLFADYL